jgi:hypothetical protein
MTKSIDIRFGKGPYSRTKIDSIRGVERRSGEYGAMSISKCHGSKRLRMYICRNAGVVIRRDQSA